MAGYADLIFKGAKPSEMPIYQATKFSTIINLKTTKELGLEIPSSLLASADERFRFRSATGAGSQRTAAFRAS
jgi:putative ABC transport system substrate-binding protein